MEQVRQTKATWFLVSIGLIACIAISLGLCAHQAYAASLASGTQEQASSEGLQASAANAKVWVISKVKVDLNDDPYTRVLGYTSNGLIRKDWHTLYAYDKNNNFRYYQYVQEKYWFTLDKKGRVAKSHVSTYAYNAQGRLSKQTTGNGALSRRYWYDKKGRLVTIKGDSGQGIDKVKFSYDSHNQVNGFTSTEAGGKVKVANTYKNGRLAKQKLTFPDSEKGMLTYTYKKISVPKSLVTRVKAQQRCTILRGLTYFAPGIETAYK